MLNTFYTIFIEKLMCIMKNQKEKSFVDFDEELVIENKILHNIKFGVYTIKVE